VLVDPASVSLSHAEIRRYSRHLILPEVGVRGKRNSKPPASC
jgi:molybdopterin/thiamine biosynthesis adenylyltransferase